MDSANKSEWKLRNLRNELRLQICISARAAHFLQMRGHFILFGASVQALPANLVELHLALNEVTAEGTASLAAALGRLGRLQVIWR